MQIDVVSSDEKEGDVGAVYTGKKFPPWHLAVPRWMWPALDCPRMGHMPATHGCSGTDVSCTWLGQMQATLGWDRCKLHLAGTDVSCTWLRQMQAALGCPGTDASCTWLSQEGYEPHLAVLGWIRATVGCPGMDASHTRLSWDKYEPHLTVPEWDVCQPHMVVPGQMWAALGCHRVDASYIRQSRDGCEPHSRWMCTTLDCPGTDVSHTWLSSALE